MRVLVTGATGLVGRHVVSRLVAAGHEVTAVARSASRTRWPSGVRAAAMNLVRPDGLAELLRGQDRVVNAAGGVVDADGPAALRAVHVEGTSRLAEASAAAGVGAIVHVSSLAVVVSPPWTPGLAESPAVRESFPAWMHYGEAKRDAERVLERHARAGSLRVSVLRPGIVLGEGDRHTTPRMLAALRRRWPVPIGSGENRPPCICAGDLAEAVASSLVHARSEYEVFALGADEGPTQAELWKWHAQAAGLANPGGHVPRVIAMHVAGALERLAAIRRQPVPFTTFDVFALAVHAPVDASKAREVLNWRPQHDFRGAILASVRSAESAARVTPIHRGGNG